MNSVAAHCHYKRTNPDVYDKIESEQRVYLFSSIPLPVWIEKNGRAEYVRVITERTPEKALERGTVFPELDISISEYERGLYDGK